MQNLHFVALFVFYFAATSIIAHVGFAFLLRVNIAFDDPASDQVFGLSNRFLMRPRFFWPWTSSPSGLDSRGVAIQVLFMAARVTGAGVMFGFLGFLVFAAMNYFATSHS